MNQLTELLQRLSEIEPAVCQLEVNGIYFMSGYRFFIADDGEFSAAVPDTRCVYVGPPALAWLRDAVERAIEARGWRLSMDQQNDWHIKISRGRQHQPVFVSRATLITALLAAFVAACEASK